MKIFKVLFFIATISIFSWYEYNLYQKYKINYVERQSTKEKNTDDIEKSFLIRGKDFFVDPKYKRKFINLITETSRNLTSEKEGD